MTLKHKYDFIIIGGGISGLFTALKLIEIKQKVLLIERDNILGGRIKTKYEKDYQYEIGSARFHSSHNKLLSLIYDLKLEKEIIKLPNDVDKILRNKKDNYDYNTKNKLDLEYLLNKSFKSKDKLSKNELINITFFQYLVLIFDHETALFIKDSFGYDSEMIHLSAYAALKMFESDFFKDNNYYILKCGLSKVISDIELILKKSNFFTLKKNTSLSEINNKKKSIITNNNDEYYYDNLILTLPKDRLKDISYFNNNLLIDSVKTINLLRIYAKYPTDNLWFKNIKRTITDNYIRHIIPIDYNNGIIMISYTDDIYANMWKNYGSISDDFLIKTLHKEIKKLFNISPPKPISINSYYWKSGIHMWKPGYNIDDIYLKIINNNNDNIYIIGETFSKKQGWIEGSLESVYDMFNNFDFKNLRSIDNISKSKQSGGNVTKKYSIDDILKKNEDNVEWIILDHNGKKPIYDVSKWIPHHPGGDIIKKKGIKANYFYKKEYEESPIELFKRYHNNKILDKYLKEKNDLVILVGYLK